MAPRESRLWGRHPVAMRRFALWRSFVQTFWLSEEEEVPLTGRELEVLRLMAKGFSNRQIATELSITERTVKYHVGNIYAKLGVSSRTEAVMYAARQGWVKV
jgi:DNA-binding NarL/FixJ family response regulator